MTQKESVKYILARDSGAHGSLSVNYCFCVLSKSKVS